MSRTIKNPRKKFNFKITIMDRPDIQSFGAQDVTMPETNIEPVEHGEGNTTYKSPGLFSTGVLTVDHIIPTDTNFNDFFFNLQLAAQDPLNGNTGHPELYELMIRVDEVVWVNNVAVPTSTRFLEGCWVTKINGREYSATASENVVESLEFAVQAMSNTPPVGRGTNPTGGLA